MKSTWRFVLVMLLFSGCGAVVTERPPDQEIVVIPAAPGAGFVWVNDSWMYNRKARTYRPSRGHWVKPRRNSDVWVDGYWIQTSKGWKYINGHWRH